MTLKDVKKDPDNLSMVVTAEFNAPVERVWQLWADPRQLERWWGPPTYPATFTSHDLAPGSRVEYHMTGPSGDRPHANVDRKHLRERRSPRAGPRDGHGGRSDAGCRPDRRDPGRRRRRRPCL